MTDPVHARIMALMSDVISNHDWDRIGEVFHADATLEYPQSGERFRGLANIRGQFENYPGLESGSSQVEEVIGDATYALTPSYTVIRVEGSGDRGTAVIRVRYPDQSRWWVLNLYDLRDGRIARGRSFFAPDFEAPEWRAPFREVS